MLAGMFKEHAKGCPTDPTARKLEGCDEATVVPTFQIDGQSFHRCPLHYVDEDVLEVVRLWKWSRKGHLPCEGGVMDQPAVLMEAIDLIDSSFESALEDQRGK